MKRLGQLALVALFSILIVQLVVFAPTSTVEDSGIEPLSETSLPEDVAQSMKGVHLIETRDGGKEWELWADQAVAFKAKAEWSLTKVRAIFFSDDGVEFVVTGETGLVETHSKNMVVTGNVITRSSNGYVFKTEKVSYSSADRRLVSPQPVVITGLKEKGVDLMRMSGNSMIAHLTDSRIEVNQNVRSERVFEDARRLVVRSDRSELSGKTKSARFMDRVVIDYDSMRVTGPDAQFQYDSATQGLKSLAVMGGVRVSDLDKWATSQRVDMDLVQDRTVFRGKPKVVQNNDELHGEEIVFTDRGRKVQVRKARARVDESRVETTN